MNHRVLLTSIVGLTFVACGGSEQSQDLDMEQYGVSSSSPIALYYAGLAPRCARQGSNGACEHRVVKAFGHLAVENLAYHKDVQVHGTWDGENWQNCKASYVGSPQNGPERWFFETNEIPYERGATFRFAIFYRVDGETYWDNNDRRDYCLTVDQGPCWPDVLGRSALALGDASVTGDRLSGRVLLKSFGFDKEVVIRYTTDGWRNTRETTASFLTFGNGGTEYWGFSGPVSRAPEVVFAIRYTVNGSSIWDNNFRENYRVPSPGSLP